MFIFSIITINSFSLITMTDKSKFVEQRNSTLLSSDLEYSGLFPTYFKEIQQSSHLLFNRKGLLV